MTISNVSGAPWWTTSIFALVNILIFIFVGVMIVYGFILLVKFLRAGTKAFNIYIDKNNISYSQGSANGDSEIK